MSTILADLPLAETLWNYLTLPTYNLSVLVRLPSLNSGCLSSTHLSSSFELSFCLGNTFLLDSKMMTVSPYSSLPCTNSPEFFAPFSSTLSASSCTPFETRVLVMPLPPSFILRF